MAICEPCHTDAYLKGIGAAVVDARDDWVTLDKAVFYARGDGQPSGLGILAEIAHALYLSEDTARNQVSKILKKLGLRARTRLAVHAAERGWTEGAPERP